tara:strand:- start:363 stop:545 length:183 start_codon:yes stop_codon:yes gene_type:complete
MDDYILILNRLNEIEEIMSNVHYEGKPLNYSNGFNQKDAFRLAKKANEKKVEEAWTKLHS